MLEARIMQAITTRYSARTKRYAARAIAGSISIPIEHPNDMMIDDKNHKAAALALCKKMDWNCADIVGGRTVKGEVVWVLVYSDDVQEMGANNAS